VLKHATTFFSHENLNLADVIPAMDHINNCMTTKANDFDFTMSPAICASLGLAKKMLNHYYSKADDSCAYQIAMGNSTFACVDYCTSLTCSN
ncbi:hypothetical protein CPC08DRAFT_647960, partial [Agrocybe pediades]